jgi:hypothetical protein
VFNNCPVPVLNRKFRYYTKSEMRTNTVTPVMLLGGLDMDNSRPDTARKPYT